MKKLYTSIVALGLSLSLIACSAGGNKTTSSAETTKAVETTVSETTKSAETTKEESSFVASNKETRTVTDHAGNTVEVPAKVERIVIDQIPILSTYMSYFEGKTPYLVGFAGSFKDTISKTVLKDIAPELYEASDTVYAQADLNIEEVIKLKPDVVFYNANNKEHAQIFKEAGIPAVGFATVNNDTGAPADSLIRYKEWLHLLEDVFGEKGKMDTFIAEGDKIVADVKSKIDAIPADKRPTAMILFQLNDGAPTVAGKGIFGDFWLKNLGVTNVAGETKGFANVSMEEIYGWNPDVLFLNGPGLLDITTQQVLENKVEGVDFSSLKAVQNARVYNTKLGMWNWFTPSPDAPLVYAWLATVTYPDEFKDYPLLDTVKSYYKQFYNYELTDEQLEDMFQ